MNQGPGKLIGIAVRSKSRAPMRQLQEAEVTLEKGVARDFRGTSGRRQVSILATEDWQAACRELGADLPWTARRANLLVEGVRLPRQADALVRIGDVVLRVSCETDPCHRMDEAAHGLRDALAPDWRGGVCCEVVTPGRIAQGDPVQVELRVASPES